MADIKAFIPFAKGVSKRYGRRIPEHDRADLESVAYLALVEAGETTNTLTKEYVKIRVRGAIVDHLRRQHRGAPRSGRPEAHVVWVSMDEGDETARRIDLPVDGDQDAAAEWLDILRVASVLGPTYVTLAKRLSEGAQARTVATEVGLSEFRISTMRAALLRALREA